MKKSILLLCKGFPDDLPPVITIAQSLARIGCDVILVCSGCGSITYKALLSEGVKVVCVHNTAVIVGGVYQKFINWYFFAKEAWKIIEKNKGYLLWVASADTALCLGHRLFLKKYILSVMELYDNIYLYRKGLLPYAQRAAAVIVPEYCRANILRVWWELKKMPEIIPNKMLIHPRNRGMYISDKYAASAFNEKINAPILLYQGHIYSDRDLVPIANALNITEKKYTFVLMGRDWDNSVEKIRKIYSDLIHIPFVAPPIHLEITSHAHFGVATYTDTSLNNVFCAPNKIYEYAGFGIPVLCRDIPGLRYTVGIEKAGVCVDLDDKEMIVSGLQLMEESYKKYSQNAEKFFEKIDVIKIISKILSSVFCDI